MEFLFQKDNRKVNEIEIDSEVNHLKMIQNLRAEMQAAHGNMERIQRDAVQIKILSLEQLLSAAAKLDSDRLELQKQRENINAERDQIEDERKQLESERLQLTNAVDRLIADRAELKMLLKNFKLFATTKAKRSVEWDPLTDERQQLKFDRETLKMERNRFEKEIESERKQLKLESDIIAREQNIAHLEREGLKKETEKLMRLRSDRTELIQQKDQMTQVEGEMAIHEISGTKFQPQKERDLLLRAKDAIALRHLITNLGELWKLFDDSHYLANGVRMNAAAIQLDRIRKVWIQVIRLQSSPE